MAINGLIRLETEMITQEYLKEILDYSPETGLFVWKKANHGVRIGQHAGHTNERGYRIIGINYKVHRAHRLAFLWMTGKFPPQYVDHINMVKDDNRWINLRKATPGQNRANSGKNKNSTSEFKGAVWYKKAQKWYAQITVNSKSKHLGCFDTPEEAHKAYCKAADKYHGEFANDGEKR